MPRARRRPPRLGRLDALRVHQDREQLLVAQRARAVPLEPFAGNKVAARFKRVRPVHPGVRRAGTASRGSSPAGGLGHAAAAACSSSPAPAFSDRLEWAANPVRAVRTRYYAALADRAVASAVSAARDQARVDIGVDPYRRGVR